MAHKPILVRPSPLGNCRRGWRPGPTFRLPTWADFNPKQRWPSILNQRWWAILGITKSARRPVPQNPSSLRFTPRLCLHPSEQRRARRPAEPGRRSGGAITWPLAGGRRSPKGQRAVVEPSCGGPLVGISSRSTHGWRRRAVELGAPFMVTNGVGSGEW
jgi:hypothetical protein